MNTPIQDPIAHACRLLREAAEELKSGHTLAKTGHDLTGEPEAKAAYDEHRAVADALERWESAIGAGGVEPLRRRECLHQIAEPAQTAPAAVAGPSEFPHEQMDAMALARYKVVPSTSSMFWSHAVVAGDGAQQLYVGREVECQNMVRKFAGAFLDGAFAFHSIAAAPTTQAAPQREVFDEDGFRAWVIRNLPDNTIIGNGEWWANHIAAWVQRFMPAATQPAPVAQGGAEQRAMDTRHAAIYRWIIQHTDEAAGIIDAWREDGEADTDELHDALAARAAKEGASHA